MAKKKSSALMTPGEQIAGTVFFMIYLLVLPFAAGPLFRLAGKLLGITFSRTLESVVTYYLLFAVSILIFHRYLARTSTSLAERLGEAGKSLGLGLVAFYGLNELVFRVGGLFTESRVHLNDYPISAQIQGPPHMTLLIVLLLLAPFVEEVLFRGLVFGNLRSKSRVGAYAASCLLFALLHVWQFAVAGQDGASFLLMLQYLVPGVVLAWVYERSGTLWTAIALHAGVNALSVWT